MTRIAPDRRTLEYEPRPEVHQGLLDRLSDWVRIQVELAKLFGAILQSKHYLDEDCASLKEYARKLGYDGVQAVKLGRIGLAILLDPRLEEEFLSRRIPLETGPYLYDALASAALRAKEDWLALARTLRPGAFAAGVRRAVEEEARGTTDLRTVTYHVTDGDRDNARRAKFLLQAICGRKLSDGEVFSKVFDDWLERHDPSRKARRVRARRRVTDEDPEARRKRLQREADRHLKRNRHIPAPTVHEVMDRSDGYCEIPGCAWEGATQLMHLVLPFAEGGDPVPRNVGNGCPRHHTLVDGGRLCCIAFSEDERPIFQDSKGRTLYPDPRWRGHGGTGAD